LRASFAEAFAARLELVVKPGELTKAEVARAAELERERYSTEAWNRSR
jgi:lipoate-protein ligase A